MAILSFVEILDVMIMALCVGYIFTNYFAGYNNFRKPADYIKIYHYGRRFIWSDFLFAVALIAPAIIFHELGHKFAAMGFGYNATFFSAISINKIISGMPFIDFASILMVIALVSTYFGGSFLFFVPAYVSFSAAANPMQTALIAFAGPAVNLILWQGAKLLLWKKSVSNKYLSLVALTARINMLLFIFNMIPLPGFDGAKVLSGLFQLIFKAI